MNEQPNALIGESKTPRTDKVFVGYPPEQVKAENCKGFVPIEFTRQLELETIQLKAQLEQERKENERIKSFEGYRAMAAHIVAALEERDEANHQLQQATAACAAMREALQFVQKHAVFPLCAIPHRPFEIVGQALSTTIGQDLLDQMKKMEEALCISRSTLKDLWDATGISPEITIAEIDSALSQNPTKE